ncbi:hypothetical protein EQG49_07810 [Periweissella cryptocerci]|uniref:Uncharacterized protein n=1 Tax=Periweissella cryptocerci TaxID=2506420 RepID=A0A4P6YUB6_9LACO|nr:SpaA isopeptide-forming pilin-related protein [Periweissella cryptocerci]QBO36374.1 hypothetical protein EQG49_07810 [Periweissella cryptocerci]
MIKTARSIKILIAVLTIFGMMLTFTQYHFINAAKHETVELTIHKYMEVDDEKHGFSGAPDNGVTFHVYRLSKADEQKYIDKSVDDINLDDVRDNATGYYTTDPTAEGRTDLSVLTNNAYLITETDAPTKQGRQLNEATPKLVYLNDKHARKDIYMKNNNGHGIDVTVEGTVPQASRLDDNHSGISSNGIEFGEDAPWLVTAQIFEDLDTLKEYSIVDTMDADLRYTPEVEEVWGIDTSGNKELLVLGDEYKRHVATVDGKTVITFSFDKHQLKVMHAANFERFELVLHSRLRVNAQPMKIWNYAELVAKKGDNLIHDYDGSSTWTSGRTFYSFVGKNAAYDAKLARLMSQGHFVIQDWTPTSANYGHYLRFINEDGREVAADQATSYEWVVDISDASELKPSEADGSFEVRGLRRGTYRLKQTDAPDDYLKLKPSEFTIARVSDAHQPFFIHNYQDSFVRRYVSLLFESTNMKSSNDEQLGKHPEMPLAGSIAGGTILVALTGLTITTFITYRKYKLKLKKVAVSETE